MGGWVGRRAAEILKLPLPLHHNTLPIPTLPPRQASPESLTTSQQSRAIDQCVSQLAARFDARLGGFGGAPKFPRPAELNVLLHQHAGEKEAAGE